MQKHPVAPFKYHVGISSLAQIATREDRVCVLNILGGESSDVTPVGHAYSGGNVVFGTSPGRRGGSGRGWCIFRRTSSSRGPARADTSRPTRPTR